jgi:hypothetical protein
MTCTRQLELQMGLRSSMLMLLRRRRLALPHLARVARIPKRELRAFVDLAGSAVLNSRSLYQRLLTVDGPGGGFWDPLSRRLLLALRDFEQFQ